eukprot:Colp12_sorted_trinity150504_noHs@15450
MGLGIHLQILLVGAKSLAVSELGLLPALLGLELLAAELAGRLDLLNVTEGIDCLLLLLELDLLGDGRNLALNLEATGVNGPDLRAELGGELGVVGNEDHTTAEGLNGTSKGTERVTVEVVGGLVEHDHVGVVPGGGTNDDLDLLTTGETTDAVVGGELRVKTDVLKVLLDVDGGEGALVGTGHLGLLVINSLNELVKTNGLEGLTAHPGVLLVGNAHPLDLVVEGTLALTTTANLLDLTLLVVDHDDLLKELLLLRGDLARGLLAHLTILTVGVTPLDVLVGGEVEVLLDVVEGVLGDVGDTEVGVLDHLTSRGLELTSKELNEGGLARTVGTEHGNTRGERASHGDVGKGGLVTAGVGEADLGHLEDGLVLGLDTIEETRLGESELGGGGLKLVVALSLRDLLDELGEVTLVALELAGLVVDDVGADVVKEARVVGDDQAGDISETSEVVLKPLDVGDVEMVGGLVEEKDISLHEHGTGKLELHLPTTREGANGLLLHVIGETDGRELSDDLGTGHGGKEAVVEEEVDNGELSLGGLEVVLDEDGTELIRRGEALDLAVVDGAHEGGLTHTVGTAETVTLTTLEVEAGVVEQNHTTISEGELAVAEILTLLILSLGHLSLVGVVELNALGKEAAHEVIDLEVGDNGVEEGSEVDVPLLVVEVLVSDELASNNGDHVLDGVGESVEVTLIEHTVEESADGGEENIGGGGELGLVKSGDAVEGGNGTSSDGTELRVGSVLRHTLKSGEELGQELLSVSGVLDELAHVVNNDGGLTEGGGRALSQSTRENGHHDGEGGGLDSLDESGGSKTEHAVRDLGGLSNALNEVGKERLDIGVTDAARHSGHHGGSQLLHLGLRVPHAISNVGEDVGKAGRDLLGGALDEAVNGLEGTELGLPLLALGHTLEQDGEDSAESKVGGKVDDSLGGLLGKGAGGGNLVGKAVEHHGHQKEKVGLSTLANNLSEGSDGVEGGITGVGGLGVLEVIHVQLKGEDTVGLHSLGKSLGGGMALGNGSVLNVLEESVGGSLSFGGHCRASKKIN